MPGPYRLVFAEKSNKTSNEIKNSKNEIITTLKKDSWLVRMGNQPDTDIDTLQRDFVGTLLIQNESRILHPNLLKTDGSINENKFNEFLENKLGKSAASQSRKHYIQPLAGGVDYHMVEAGLKSTRIMINSASRANIYTDNSDTYLESIISHFTIIHSDSGEKIELPGYIISKFKLTKNGFLLESSEASNSFLHKVRLSNKNVVLPFTKKTLDALGGIAPSDILITQQELEEARQEEVQITQHAKDQLNQLETHSLDRLSYEERIFSELAALINKTIDDITPLEDLVQQKKEAKVDLGNIEKDLFVQGLEILYKGVELLKDNTLCFDSIRRKLIPALFEISTTLNTAKDVLPKSEFTKNDEFKIIDQKLSSAHVFLQTLHKRIHQDLQANSKVLEELKSLAANVGVDSTVYQNDSNRRKLIEKYKLAHFNFFVAEDDVKYALDDANKSQTKLTLEKCKYDLMAARSKLMINFGEWLRLQRNSNISNKNGTFFINQQDASIFKLKLENYIHNIATQTLNLKTDINGNVAIEAADNWNKWLKDNSQDRLLEGENYGRAFGIDFPRDAKNGSWIFYKQHNKTNENIEKNQDFTHIKETQELIVANTVEDLFEKLSCSAAVQRCLSYILCQTGLSFKVNELLKNYFCGDKAQICHIGTKHRQTIIRMISDTKFEVEQIMTSDVPTFASPLSQNQDNTTEIESHVTITIDSSEPKHPKVTSTFEIASIKPINSNFNFKFSAGLLNPVKTTVEDTDFLIPYTNLLAFSVGIDERFVNDDWQPLDCISSEYAAHKNKQFKSILMHLYGVKKVKNPLALQEVNFVPKSSGKLVTENAWKSAAHQIIRLADKELKKISKLKDIDVNTKAEASQRFNYLKQVGYNLLVEIAAINLAKGKKVEESLKVFSRVLAHSKESRVSLHPRVEELLAKTPKRMVEFANDKLSILKPNTDAYKRYELMADKGLDILHKQAEQAYEELVQAKNDNDIDKIKDIFTRLRVLSTFLYETNSAFTPELMQLYSNYEKLAREIIRNNNFKQVEINDKKISKNPIELGKYINIIFGYDYTGNPSPEVRFKDWICTNNISRGKVSLREVLENMTYPSPLTIPYATSATNPKVKQELADLIKDLNKPLNELDNSKQKIQSNFRNLLESNEEILPQEKREGFARLVYRTGLPRQQPKTAIRLRMLSDRELMAQIKGDDLIALVKNDFTSALKSLEVGFFDGLFKTNNIKKYTGNDLLTLLITNGGQKEIAEAVFDPKRRTFRNYYADKLTGDNLVSLVFKTTVADEYLIREAKLAKRLLTVDEEKLQNLLTARPLLFEELIKATGDNITEQRWKVEINQAKLALQQANEAQAANTPRTKKDYGKLVKEVSEQRGDISPRGVKSTALVGTPLVEDKNIDANNKEKITTVSSPLSTKLTPVK